MRYFIDENSFYIIIDVIFRERKSLIELDGW